MTVGDRENAGLVVVTNGNYFAQVILRPLFARRNTDIRGVIIISGDYTGQEGMHALWSVGRKTTLPYLGAKIIQGVFVKVLAMVRPDSVINVAQLADRHGVQRVNAASVNDTEVLEALEKWKGQLLVSVSCPQKLRQEHLAWFTKGGVNIHSSLLPSYGGLAPYYWVLANRERVTGTSVHVVTERFDQGNIVAQTRVEVEEGISAFGLFEQLAEAGSETIIEAIDRVLSGDQGAGQDVSQRSYYSHPTFESYVRLRRNGFVVLRCRDLYRVVTREAGARRGHA